MDDNKLELAVEAYAAKHFVDDAVLLLNKPWPEARNVYKATLVRFAVETLTAMWVPVDEELPEDDEWVLVYAPDQIEEDLAMASWDGENWYTINGTLLRPSLWRRMSKPEVRKEVRHEH